MQFEVQIPKRSNPGHIDTLLVEGPNWLFALRDGLHQLGDSMEMRNMICEILGENVVQIQESNSGRTFSIKPWQEAEVAVALAELAHRTDTRAEDLPAVHAVPAGATEAFLPPLEFFENQQHAPLQSVPVAVAKNVEVSVAMEGPSWHPSQTMQTPQDVLAPIEESLGQPVSLEVTSPPTSLSPLAKTFPNRNEDIPFALSNVASSERLPEEDLDFSAPLSIDVHSSGPASAVEQPAIMEPPAAVSHKPLPKPTSSKAALPEPPLPKPEPPRRPTPSSPPSAGLSISSVASPGGKYSPGMTTEILADAFMRAMEIYEYGEDRHAAMQFVLDLALNNVNAFGGCVLLTDINSPNQELWFEVAIGPKSEDLLNFRIPMGQGIIGFCAQEGVSQLIANPKQEPRYQEDVLNLVKLDPGSILAVPIQHQKRMLGVIAMYAQQGDRPFTQGELSILNYLAHTAGEYLINLI